jgi:hypothetical protein
MKYQGRSSVFYLLFKANFFLASRHRIREVTDSITSDFLSIRSSKLHAFSASLKMWKWFYTVECHNEGLSTVCTFTRKPHTCNNRFWKLLRSLYSYKCFISRCNKLTKSKQVALLNIILISKVQSALNSQNIRVYLIKISLTRWRL